MAIGRYQKKRVIVDAVQLKRNNLKEVETFLAGQELPSSYPRRKDFNINWGNSTIEMKIRDDANETYTMVAEPGDWIIQFALGDNFTCSDKEFKERFEPCC